MRRRLACAVLTAGAVWAVWGAALRPAAAAAPDVRIVKGPYLQNVRPDRVTVVWETDRPASGVVEYGRGAALGLRAADKSTGLVHEVTLAGLAPRTRYRYRVRSGGAQSEPADFTTAFLGRGAFSFAVYGDTRDLPERHALVVRLILSRKPDFVLHTGDLVNDGDEYEDWGREFFGPAGPLMRSRCLWPAVGNHDGDGRYFRAFFALPEPERWYSFTWGNARFIALDTNSDLSPRSRQFEWLAAELARKGARWTFVFMHYPVMSGGPHGGVLDPAGPLAALFERGGVDIVFQGHNHIYERTYPMRSGRRVTDRGVVYVTTAGGGAPLYGYRPMPFLAEAASRLHACFVRIDGPDLYFEARDVEGAVVDRFEMTRDAGRRVRLLRALAGPDPARSAAELGLLGEARAVKPLEGLARSGPAEVRRAAVEALARINPPGAGPLFARLARDRDAGVRRFALRGLARAGGAERLSTFLSALDDPHPAVAAEAVDALAWLRAREALERLVALIGRRKTPSSLRRRAVEALGIISTGRQSFEHLEGLQGAEEILVGLLEHPDPAVAAEAAKALEKYPTPAVRRALASALERPFWVQGEAQEELEEQVLKALKKTADPSCAESLLRYVADPRRHPKNRERAGDVLDRITGLNLDYDPRKPAADLAKALRLWRAALKELEDRNKENRP